MPADDALLADLTDAQRAAATHRDGALLVLAGPGSGKTTVVTRRIACLIAGGVEPWRILALTFTNKAAGEMRQRVETLLAGGLLADGAPTVATFHSFCARLLRRFAEQADIAPGFSIYDEGDRREALKDAIKQAGLSAKNWTPASVGAAISSAKNRLLDAAAYTNEARDFYTRSIARVYTAYEKVLAANDALDFDDLLLRTAATLRRDEQTRTRLQRRYQYLLIDEYQDTNHAQFVIAHTLAAGHGNICVVGDPDQSIYAWRGADIGNILEFETHHPDAVIVPLGQNFRSTGHIVAAADGLIRHNRRRKHKDLFTDLDDGERPTVIVCRNEHHEASVVAEFLDSAMQCGLPWREMAVLYRINALSRVLEEALRNAGIPYVIARGTAFYERKEVRDALAYLRVVANPRDEVALRRIVNTPARGIGKTTLDRIELHAINRQQSLGEAMRDSAAVEGLSGRAVKSVVRFVQLIDELRRCAAEGSGMLAGTRGLAGLVEHVVRHSGLEATYRGDTDEDRQRLANLAEVVSAAADFSPPPDAEVAADDVPGRLSLFLESVALVSDADAIDPERGSVTLMSLHAAKGLEFDAVALIGLEQNLLPHARASESEAEMEEERRLCFVGMTRARRRLLMTRAAVRTYRGIRAGTIASCFLGELPRDAVDFVDRTGGAVSDDYADPALYEAAYPVGCIVRHPQYGLGRIESVEPRASGAAARVAFPAAGTKTLILEHAALERVG